MPTSRVSDFDDFFDDDFPTATAVPRKASPKAKPSQPKVPSKPAKKPLEPEPDDVGISLYDVIQALLEDEPPQRQDMPLASLALVYADDIDNGGDLTKLGPSLLSALEALQLSPRARALAKKGVTDAKQPPANAIDELRARRLGKGGA